MGEELFMRLVVDAVAKSEHLPNSDLLEQLAECALDAEDAWTSMCAARDVS